MVTGRRAIIWSMIAWFVSIFWLLVFAKPWHMVRLGYIYIHTVSCHICNNDVITLLLIDGRLNNCDVFFLNYCPLLDQFYGWYLYFHCRFTGEWSSTRFRISWSVYDWTDYSSNPFTGFNCIDLLQSVISALQIFILSFIVRFEI